MPLINEALRSEAQYRITFENMLRPDWAPAESAEEAHRLIAQRIGDILAAFPTDITEIRVDAASETVGVYLVIPADVLPEALDKRADALRAKWRAETTVKGA